MLLLTTPSAAFDTVVPVLVLLASILLAFQPLITRRLRQPEDGDRTGDPAWLYVALFLATVYGGYFGGALGVILVGVLGLGLGRLKLANAIKSALSLVTARSPSSSSASSGRSPGSRGGLRPGQPDRRLPRRRRSPPASRAPRCGCSSSSSASPSRSTCSSAADRGVSDPSRWGWPPLLLAGTLAAAAVDPRRLPPAPSPSPARSWWCCWAR